MQAPIRKYYDLVIYGSGTAGISCGVRAAREELTVLLVVHTPHLGGMLTSGLCVWDTQFEGKRAPVYDELRQSIFDYYLENYGGDTKQYRLALPGEKGHNNGNFEPKVARQLVEQLVAREPNIEVVRGYYPCKVVTKPGMLQSVLFQKMDGDEQLRVSAEVFADCSYEGDLMAITETAYRYGRESREEFGEPHAGRIFARAVDTPPNDLQRYLAKRRAGLNLRPFHAYMEVIDTRDSGKGDKRVQAYNWRTVLSFDPDNQVVITKPESYEPAIFKGLEFLLADQNELPNSKLRINRPQLIERQNSYVEGTWEDRRKVMDDHWEALQGMIYYYQNEPTAPADLRQLVYGCGWAKDEFTDNGYKPYEIYVREARRLAGRYTYTQHDVSWVDEINRTPIHYDSIAVSDWYVDVHACTDERVADSMHEGKIMLHQETFPGQIPYRTILPCDLDNLLVPVCLSSSHIAWSAVRLEPTWMNIGESAGVAAVLAVKTGKPPAIIDPDLLLRELVKKRIMISFFNDVDIAGEDPWVPAVQYFGTKGFFPGYEANAGDRLTKGVAKLWAEGFSAIQKGEADSEATASRIEDLNPDPEPISETDFFSLTGINYRSRETDLTKGQACILMFEKLENESTIQK